MSTAQVMIANDVRLFFEMSAPDIDVRITDEGRVSSRATPTPLAHHAV
jgi:hypothetical protein